MINNNIENNKIYNNIENNGTPSGNNKNSGKEKLYTNVNYEIENNLNGNGNIKNYINTPPYEETPADSNNNNHLQNMPLKQKKE